MKNEKEDVKRIKHWLDDNKPERYIVMELRKAKWLFKFDNLQEIAFSACKNSKIDVLKCLFNLGMKGEILYKTEHLLFLDTVFYNSNILKLFLDQMTDFNVKDKYNRSLLIHATMDTKSRLSRVKTIKLLLKYCDVDSKTSAGFSSIYYAYARPYCFDIVTLLLKRGASLKANHSRFSPLKYFVKNLSIDLKEHFLLLKLLIDLEPDINVQSRQTIEIFKKVESKQECITVMDFLLENCIKSKKEMKKHLNFDMFLIVYLKRKGNENRRLLKLK